MCALTTRSGHYPIERRSGEIERLRIQNDALAADTAHMLDQIGVCVGWHCLDLGCGPRGITDALSARVGSVGRVAGLDFDAAFIEIARSEAGPNTSFVTGDAYATGLPARSFDLVHLRFLASTAGQPERLIGEAARLARPGGWVALQEADFATLNCHPPHPAWTALRCAFIGCFPGSEGEPAAQQTYRLLRAAGLRDVQYRPVLIGVRAEDAWRDYLPATVESLRGSIVQRGLLEPEEIDPLLAACRGHLADADTIFTSYTIVQVWGRVPEAG